MGKPTRQTDGEDNPDDEDEKGDRDGDVKDGKNPLQGGVDKGVAIKRLSLSIITQETNI